MRILRRTLIGHSFGGLFTVNAVLTQPHAFDDFIAADPSFWWDQRRLIQKAAADGLGDKAAAGSGRRLYLGFATKPRKDRTASAERPAAGGSLVSRSIGLRLYRQTSVSRPAGAPTGFPR